MAERGGRRFSQAISEGDGISVIVHVDGPEAARAAEAEGAEALVLREANRGVRDATELPILWCGSGSLAEAHAAGADAVLIVAREHEDAEGVRLGEAADAAVGHGLDWVVSVASEDELVRVLELNDPETFHLAVPDLERALELLSDVPVGKLAIAEAEHVTREEIEELERRGVDAVIVPARNVAELVGGAPPTV